MAAYHSDARAISLDDLQDRLLSTDLIPSQEPLRNGLAEKMEAIRAAGVQNVADLRAALKRPKPCAALSESAGVDVTYLRLLQRAINGFFPKPRPLKDIDWLGSDAVAGLAKAGITNTEQLFDAANDGKADLAKRTGVKRKTLEEFTAIADLCRIQWVSPVFARVILATGLDSAAAVARAKPETLCDAMVAANADAKFYKGKVGLRDVRRLVKAAAYVP